MKIQFYYPPGGEYVFTVRRVADGSMVDPADLQLKAPADAAWTFPLAEEAAPNRGSYLADFGPIAAKAALDGAFEVSLRRADRPDEILDGFPLYFKDGAGHTIAQLFSEVGPAVVAEVRSALRDLQVTIPLSLGRRGAQSS